MNKINNQPNKKGADEFMFQALFDYAFLQNAVFSSLLASVICGVVGPIVLEKRMVMLSGGIAHTAFGGIGLGYLLKFPPIFGALLFSVAASLGIGKISRTGKDQADVLIGIFWSIGMALGILFISMTPGYPPDMTSYLFGNILAVTRNEIYIIGALSLITIFTVLAFFHQLKAYLFDQEFSYIQGVPIKGLEYLLFILLGVTIVVLIRIVGFILIIALFTAPPAVAKKFSYDLKQLMGISILINLGCSLFGLWLSYQLNIASGATIILVLGILYLMTIMSLKIKTAVSSQ